MVHPFVPVPNTIQLRQRFTTPGGIAENVYHVQGTGLITDIPGMGNALMNALAGWEGGHAQNQRGAGIICTQIIATDMGSETGWRGIKNVNIPGGKGGDLLPMHVTIAVKWTTDQRGRSFRGRTYHVGLTTQHVAGQNVWAGAITDLTSCYQALLAALNAPQVLTGGTTQGGMVVVSKRSGKADRAQGLATTITGVTFTDTVVDSMRRRLPAHHIYR